jgi:ribonuclease BN (tRNA processing enzyme)
VQAEHNGRDANLVLDMGNGALGALQRHIKLDDLDAVALTHLHPDHVVDVCGLYVTRKYRPGGRYRHELPVYGPHGTELRLALMYHGIDPPGMAGEFDFRVLHDGEPFTVGPFRVTPMRVNHPVNSFGFRVEADGKVLAYSGDTDSSPALTPLFTDADLVLCDSAWMDGRDTIRGIHLSGSRAAQAAIDAGGVKRLMLTHIPPWNDPEVCRAQAAAVWPGEVELAEPDKTYDV